MKYFLIIPIVFCWFNTLFADGVQPIGSGTEANPYQVDILDNLLWISTNSDSWSCNFVQIADIDMSDTQNWNNGEGFIPIGNETIFFTGSYDGEDHKISNLYINRPDSDYQGFFGYVSDAVIRRLSLVDIAITGHDYVGGLIGYNPHTEISFCSCIGTITGNCAVGGIAGWNNFADLNSCYSNGVIEGSYQVGGLLGANFFDTIITNCFSFANVIGDDCVGGLTGQNGYSIIKNCYSIGTVTANSRFGGLIGWCYSSNIENSFWNVETSGQTTSSGGGIGLTTIEMQQLSTYVDYGWDFVDNPTPDLANNDYWNWDGINNDIYPFLSWQEFSSPLAAYFTTDVVCTDQNSIVHFYDLSTGNPTGWSWDFNNDGTIDSYEQDPLWCYDEAGTYSISLTIEDQSNFSFSGKTDYIIVIPNILPEGNGTEDDPYLINYLGNLVWLSYHPEHWDKHYVQTADIDASATQNWFEGAGFSAIGKEYDESFSGVYDGQNHIIDEILVYQPDTWFQGLFGFLLNATVKNLGVTNVNVTGTDYCGGLAGRSQTSFVTNCFSSGNVSGESSIGGLIGHNHMDASLTNSYSTANVNGSRTGVLVGYNQWNSTISNCFSYGNVSGFDSVGGLVGYCGGSSTHNSYIDKCFSVSSINGFGDYIGGLVGCDNYGGITTNSFWDIEISGITISAGGTGKTTIEMKNVATYTSFGTTGLDEPWDFVGNPYDDIGMEDIWNIEPSQNDGYPFLCDPVVETSPDEIIPSHPICGLANFPNPFNPSTEIRFQISDFRYSENAEISIFNLKGQKIKTLPVILSPESSLGKGLIGQHSVIWNGRDENNKPVSSGIYFYKLKAGEFEQTKKMLLLK